MRICEISRKKACRPISKPAAIGSSRGSSQRRTQPAAEPGETAPRKTRSVVATRRRAKAMRSVS